MAGDYVNYTYDNLGELLSNFGAEPALRFVPSVKCFPRVGNYLFYLRGK